MLNRTQIAQLVAQDLPDGAVVNLGIGMPTAVADYLPAEREILLHSENGILGMGGVAQGEAVDWDLINASRQPVTLRAGASITEHTVSFAMMRGGHLDYALLGGFQVAANGDLANWITDAEDAIPAIGGAMDLAVGARNVWVMLEHVTKSGAPKLLQHCTYPLTGAAVVNRVYTDRAVLDVTPQGFVVHALLEQLTLAQLQACTGAPLQACTQMRTIRLTASGHPEYATTA